MSVSIQELKKAITSLDEAIKLHSKSKGQPEEQKAFRDACIQRFEYGIELSWKTAMKALGSTTAAAKPAIREMARSNLIQDIQLWFDFIDARNQTSHSYDEAIAEKVFKAAEKFYPEALKLIKELDKK